MYDVQFVYRARRLAHSFDLNSRSAKSRMLVPAKELRNSVTKAMTSRGAPSVQCTELAVNGFGQRIVCSYCAM